jgi:hypothetical protein
MKHEIRKDGELVATIETHGDAVVVVHEPANPDYSHLIGKWVRCIGGSVTSQISGKWYQVLRNIFPGLVISDENGDNDYVWFYPNSSFDLSSPRDTNPDEEERVIPFDAVRWRKGDFVRVQQRDGREVMQLTKFECCDSYPLRGVYDGELGSWKKDGAYGLTESRYDLMLVVKGGDQ